MQLGTSEPKLKRYTQAQVFMDILRQTKRKVKPGDKLTVWTIKGSQTGIALKSEVCRKAKVIAVYPRFVRARLCSRNGRQACEESFMWDDVARWNKHLWEGVQDGR